MEGDYGQRASKRSGATPAEQLRENKCAAASDAARNAPIRLYDKSLISLSIALT
jgi:hypothetical protein